MSILGFILVLVVLCLAGFFVQNYMTMDAKLKQLAIFIIGIAVVVVILFFCLQLFGVGYGGVLRVR